MNGFADIFKNSFLEGYSSIDVKTILVAMGLSCVFSLYIFAVYRVMTRKVFYSKAFNIALLGVTLITTAIILTIQSSVVVSLGMVGALSIVRFRTAVKEPMDLMFLFWAISVGIICGAGVAEIALILSLLLTIALLVLNRIPVTRSPMLLLVNATDLNLEDTILAAAEKFAYHPVVKSRSLTPASADYVIELRTRKGAELVSSILALEGVASASLMEHDGEVTF